MQESPGTFLHCGVPARLSLGNLGQAGERVDVLPLYMTMFL